MTEEFGRAPESHPITIAIKGLLHPQEKPLTFPTFTASIYGSYGSEVESY